MFILITSVIVLWAFCYNILDHSVDDFRDDCARLGLCNLHYVIKRRSELQLFICAPLVAFIWFGPLRKLVRANLIKDLKEERTALTYKEMKSFQQLEDKWL